MSRSPLQVICKSNSPCLANRSSMCSRKGSPIEIFDLPLPSRLSLTRTSVSFVLRRTSARRALLLSLDFIQCLQYPIVFLRRTETKPEVVAQHRIPAHIPNEDVAPQQLVKDLLRIPVRFD